MKEKIEEFELKLYELLGVKQFKKLAFIFRKILFRIICFWMKKDKINEFLNSNTGDNYTVNKTNGINGFKNFRISLILNASIHIIPIIFQIVNLMLGNPFSIATFLIIITNGYCVMLQRYNWIRINKIIKRGEKREKRQKEALLKDLSELDSEIDKHSYKQENKKKDDISITYDDFCKNATLEHLKQYKVYLENMKNLLEYLKDYEKQNNLKVTLPKDKQKVLDININYNDL